MTKKCASDIKLYINIYIMLHITVLPYNYILLYLYVVEYIVSSLLLRCSIKRKK